MALRFLIKLKRRTADAINNITAITRKDTSKPYLLAETPITAEVGLPRRITSVR